MLLRPAAACASSKERVALRRQLAPSLHNHTHLSAESWRKFHLPRAVALRTKIYVSSASPTASSTCARSGPGGACRGKRSTLRSAGATPSPAAAAARRRQRCAFPRRNACPPACHPSSAWLLPCAQHRCVTPCSRRSPAAARAAAPQQSSPGFGTVLAPQPLRRPGGAAVLPAAQPLLGQPPARPERCSGGAHGAHPGEEGRRHGAAAQPARRAQRPADALLHGAGACLHGWLTGLLDCW